MSAFIGPACQAKREVNEYVFQDKQVEFVIPYLPVKLSLEHDRMLSFINELGGETKKFLTSVVIICYFVNNK